jgi:hypothetical protein
MRRENPENSLEATALVHEAYIRLIDAKIADWQDRAHFFAISAQMMRRILVDAAPLAKPTSGVAGSTGWSSTNRSTADP